MSVRIAHGKGCKVVSYPPQGCHHVRLFSYSHNEKTYPVCIHPEGRSNYSWLVKCPLGDKK